MSRILLADDSPHAQRMGERILRHEGHEVVTVTDGETAVLRLADVDPDLILADAHLPGKSGYDICEYAKKHPRHRHARVVLIAGLLERVDEELVAMSGADLVLRKPFEASALVAAITPLLDAAAEDRAARPEMQPAVGPKADAFAPAPPVPAVPEPATPPAVAVMPKPAPPEITPVPPAPPLPPAPAASERAETPPAPEVMPEPAPPAQAGQPEPAADLTVSAPQEPAEVDPERVRAAVVLALHRAMPALVDELTQEVLIALQTKSRVK